jgi:ribose-phosphate pyrophosphokinase
VNHLDIRIPEDRDRLYTVIKYPAGEIQTRLTDAGLLAVVKANTYRIIANPIPDPIELAQLNDAVNDIGRFAERTVYLPYLPFSRADRRFMKGDTYGMRTYFQLLRAMGFTKVQTFDVHSAWSDIQATSLGLTFENFEPMADIKTVIEDIGDGGLCIVLPDKGSRNRYDFNKVGINVPVLQGDKIRDPLSGKLSGFTIDPYISGFSAALIVDDICDGGGTFIGLGNEIHKVADPINLYLYTSHGIYSQGEEKLRTVFKELFTSSQGFNGKPKEVLG